MGRPSKFTDDQIRQALNTVEAGMSVVKLCRTLGITQTTFYRWRKKFGGSGSREHSEVRDLRTENQKLKQIVANLLLEKL